MHLLLLCMKSLIIFFFAQKDAKETTPLSKMQALPLQHRPDINSKSIRSFWFHNVAKNVSKFLLSAFQLKTY